MYKDKDKDKDKKIAELDREITTLKKDLLLLKKQLAQAVRAITVMEKKLNRVYHDHNNVSSIVQNITAQLRRLG